MQYDDIVVGAGSAGAVIATIPVLGIYALVQKEFTEGISMSGLKG
mgnify:CR=1 FL=1